MPDVILCYAATSLPAAPLEKTDKIEQIAAYPIKNIDEETVMRIVTAGEWVDGLPRARSENDMKSDVLQLSKATMMSRNAPSITGIDCRVGY